MAQRYLTTLVRPRMSRREWGSRGLGAVKRSRISLVMVRPIRWCRSSRLVRLSQRRARSWGVGTLPIVLKKTVHFFTLPRLAPTSQHATAATNACSSTPKSTANSAQTAQGKTVSTSIRKALTQSLQIKTPWIWTWCKWWWPCRILVALATLKEATRAKLEHPWNLKEVVPLPKFNNE